jgi:hypothetical protein
MQKMLLSVVLFSLLSGLYSEAFGGSLHCRFKDQKINDIDKIEINDQSLIINNEMEIPLEKTRVICGNFGRQMRLDGSALGYQVVLKSCSTEAKLEGHLIDSLKVVAADIQCFREELK